MADVPLVWVQFGACAALIAVAAAANGAALQRLSAEFQSGGEVATTATPAPSPSPGAIGGIVVYDKIISLPQNVTYITFSAQGDTHQDGNNEQAGLLMSASVVDSAGNETICQPMASAGGAAEFGAPWMTLVKLPNPGTGGCSGGAGDGGGGPADCHDNAFSFSCCVLTRPDANGTTHHVKIRMASTNGATVFYEDSTILIDSGPNAGGSFCTAAPLDGSVH